MNKTVCALLVLFAASLSAAAERPSAPEWGSAQPSILNVFAWEFQPLDTRLVLGTTVGSFYRYAVSTPPGVPTSIEAAVHLPTGVIIEKIEVVGCDTSDKGFLTAVLYRVDDPFPGNIVLGSATLPGSGCTSASSDPIDHQVDNSAGSYGIEISLPIDSGVSVRSVRVYYHLQVSPAPEMATFNDVPTGHPFFQYVEALAASGITGGCGGANYCPDAPLTRGQMAVFLAKALGLHFPF